MNEIQLQSQCYIWFHNTYTQYRGLLCCNYNNSHSVIQGNRNKATGVQKGRSDMVLYYNGKSHHIEIKLPHTDQSKDQIKWQSIIEAAGFDYYIIDNFQDFCSLIKKLL